ncbi:hypothetical protein AKJ63_00200 [candidate division MSBL1 archaeon SCGC-AAA259D18]|nr:hypothetical protein AKJ63_00200 [candidate division MSBL1 archaeon SCGC-AAA259D18]
MEKLSVLVGGSCAERAAKDVALFTLEEGEKAEKLELKIGLVGTLLTLFPPLSMIAFISLTLPVVGKTITTVAVIIYSIAIISIMSLIGGGIGNLFDIMRTENEQIHALSQCIASIMIIGFAGYLLSHNLVGLF